MDVLSAWMWEDVAGDVCLLGSRYTFSGQACNIQQQKPKTRFHLEIVPVLHYFLKSPESVIFFR